MLRIPHRLIFKDVEYEPDKTVALLFTGRKDTDGRELYEGDIIRYLNVLEQDVICRVHYSEVLAAFCLLDDQDLYIQHLFNILSRYKVSKIGNGFENPELVRQR